MFSSKNVSVVELGKYQACGVSERVMITEVMLNINEQFGTKTISFTTSNENGQEGRSKKLSLKTEIGEGKKCSGWDMTARSLKNILMSMGDTEDEANNVLEAKDENQLVKNLSKGLIGRPVRALFSSREYNPGKFAIELYVTEPVGGTKLKWDPSNKFYNEVLPKPEGVSASSDGLPF